MDRKRTSSPLTLQQLAGAAERLRARETRERGQPRADWLALVEEAHDRLSWRPFVAPALPAFLLSDGGKERLVASPVPGDRLIEEALLPILSRAIEPLLLPSVHGCRRAHSTLTAATDASRAVSQGFAFLSLLDVHDYYPSIDRERLREKLAPLVAEALIEIVAALLAAPLMSNGERVDRPQGIPLGRPVSPVLANLYLTELDAVMQGLDVVYVRYVDDLFVAARSEEHRAAAEQRIAATLATLGLQLGAEKAQRLLFDGTPFVYLGHAVDAKGVYERLGGQRLASLLLRRRPAPAGAPHGDYTTPQRADLAEPLEEHPNRRSHTLYVTEPGLYLSVRSGMVVVQRARDVVREVPVHRVDRILVLAGASMSSGFLSTCIAASVPVLFFVGKGKAYGSLVAGGMPNPLRLRAQYDLVSQPDRRLALARAVIEAKLDAMLRRLGRARQTSAIRERIADLRGRIAAVPDADTLRGLEGAATRTYYEGFALRIKKEGFAFTGRSKRPPRDPINSLLSFAYSLLFGEMQTALLAEGLDPHPGLLHDLRPGHPALASDLIEPYRVLIADSFVLTVVNNGQIPAEGFEARTDGGVYLAREPRRTFLTAYEAYVDRVSGGGRGTTSPRRLIHAAARAMLRVVLGEAEALRLPLVTEGDEGGTEPALPAAS